MSALGGRVPLQRFHPTKSDVGSAGVGHHGAACARARFVDADKASTKGKILVADDSLLSADLLCAALREHGYSIVGRMLAAGRPHGDLRTSPSRRVASVGEQVLKVREHVRVTRSVLPGGAEDMTFSMCDLHPARPANRQSAASGSHGKRNGVRVFLVEGDSHCRATLAALLMKMGLDVQSFDEDAALCESLIGDGEARRRSRPEGDVACGRLALDQSQRRAVWNGSVVPLSAGEFEIVLLLAANAGRYVGHRAIYDCLHYQGFVAGNGDNGFCVNVRSAIRRIRKKFRTVDGDFCQIANSWAFGYCWRQDPAEIPPAP